MTLRTTFYSATVVLFLLSCSVQKNVQNSRADQILKEFLNPKSETVLVAAHRAGHNGYPENSLSAFKHAIDIGVDIIETDVKVTKDSVVVLMHDGKIDRTTNGTGNPENYTLAELKQFRLKMPDGKLTDETIATFEDALNLIKGKVMVDIDIKTSHLKPIADVVRKTGTEKQVFYFDNDYDALKEVLSYQPDAMLMPRAYSYAMADSALKVFHPNVIHIDESFHTSQLTDMIRNKNARILINALGEADNRIRKGEVDKVVEYLLRFKANIIQTDEPEKLIRHLEAKGLRKF